MRHHTYPPPPPHEPRCTSPHLMRRQRPGHDGPRLHPRMRTPDATTSPPPPHHTCCACASQGLLLAWYYIVALFSLSMGLVIFFFPSLRIYAGTALALFYSTAYWPIDNKPWDVSATEHTTIHTLLTLYMWPASLARRGAGWAETGPSC